MNVVVARLTFRSLLGRRRSLVLLLLPAVLLALALLVRGLGGTGDDATLGLTWAFGFATVLPLLGLIAGTGVIAPEIGDGSIVYLLAKPVRRSSITLAKYLVACAVVCALGAIPTFAAAVLLSGEVGGLALAILAGAMAASAAYAAVFLLLGVTTRNAVVVGLLYALVWEGAVGSFVPGAQVISVQQWAFSITEGVLGDGRAAPLGVDAAVSTTVGTVLLVVLVCGALVLATRRLRNVRISPGEE